MTTFAITNTYDSGELGFAAVGDERLREFWWAWCPRLRPSSIIVGGPNADEFCFLDLDDDERDDITPERLLAILTEHYADPANVDDLVACWFQWVADSPKVLDEVLEDEQYRWLHGLRGQPLTQPT